jgi:hypothetical protein
MLDPMARRSVPVTFPRRGKRRKRHRPYNRYSLHVSALTRRELGQSREIISMTYRVPTCLHGTLLLLATLSLIVSAAMANAAEMTNLEAHLANAASSQKTAYIMFYRQNDAPTQAMHQAVKAHCDQLGDRATWLNVSVSNSNAAELIAKYDATRSPMPTLVSVAPNGAVAGVYPLRVDANQLQRSILTPQYAEMVKAMQEKKIAVVCLQPATGGYVPQGVQTFLATPAFQGQTQLVSVNAADPAEGDFFARMKVQPNLTSPVVMMFAPPGVHLGTYNAQVNAAALATKVHQSGSCNCEKCQQK